MAKRNQSGGAEVKGALRIDEAVEPLEAGRELDPSATDQPAGGTDPSRGSGVLPTPEQVAQKFRHIEATLETAKFGLADVTSPDPKRRGAGLRNVAVFGRATTFALQSLRGVVVPGFDDWYKPRQATMAADPLMKAFRDLRNLVEKTGELPVSGAMSLAGDPMALVASLPRPPNTTGFFMGDSVGGCGWLVSLPDGSVDKYYVDIPAGNPYVTFQAEINLGMLPEPYGSQPVENACAVYLKHLQGIVDEAKRKFASASSTSTGRS